jgi:NTP pyrophosphatase (non-canonical NTP hydrolase)
MTANEYQKAALRTASGMNYEHHGMLMNGALGLCGESGEVADLVKKATFQGHELDVTHVAEELGDVAWYLAETAHAIGYDLETILQMNIDKLRARYPEGFSSERSIKREE